MAQAQFRLTLFVAMTSFPKSGAPPNQTTDALFESGGQACSLFHQKNPLSLALHIIVLCQQPVGKKLFLRYATWVTNHYFFPLCAQVSFLRFAQVAAVTGSAST
jgi:hypothetical protein